MDFLLSDNAERNVRHHLPLHLTKYAIPGAQCRYIYFRHGEVISQVILGNDYSIWSHHFFIRSRTLLRPYAKENLIALHFMLAGSATATLHGFGHLELKEAQCHLFYVPGAVQHDVTFDAGSFQSMHINFHPAHLAMIARQYPQFEPMLSMATQDIKTGQQHPVVTITPQIKNIIQQIFFTSLKPAERVLLIESSVRDLLRLYIQDVTKGGHEYSMDMQQKLMIRVEEYITQQLDKPLTVEVISRHFSISRSWLQQVSKNVMGYGIYHLVRSKRMEVAARLLLETNHPVGAIVMMTSDMTFAAFTASFHGYYGITPLQYRKGRGQNK